MTLSDLAWDYHHTKDEDWTEPSRLDENRANDTLKILHCI